MATDLGVIELKSILRSKNIATTGKKAELILRLQQHNPDESWIDEWREGGKVVTTDDTEDHPERSQLQDAYDIMKRQMDEM